MKKVVIAGLASASIFMVAGGAFAQGQKIKPLIVQKATQDSALLGGLGGGGVALTVIAGVVLLIAAAGGGGSTSGTN